MFNGTLSNRRRYNASVSGASTYPVDVFEAFERFYLASRTLSKAGFSGVYADQKPRGKPNPCLVLKAPESSRYTSDSDTLWNRLTLTFYILGSTKAETASLCETTITGLKNATFEYGPSGSVKTSPLWLKNVRRTKDLGETALGEKVFRAQIDFECFEFRPRY